MSPTIGWVIMIVHIAIVMWKMYAPFSSIPTVRMSYVVLAPFLMLHWILNDDTCALTLLECKMRGLEDCSQSFIHKIVSPVYKITDKQARLAAWGFTIFAWFYATSKTSWSEFRDLFHV